MTSPFDKVCPYCRGTGFKRPGTICLCVMKKDIPKEVNDLFDLLNVKEKTKSV